MGEEGGGGGGFAEVMRADTCLFGEWGMYGLIGYSFLRFFA